LGAGLDAMKRAGVDWVSVDVMDGHFVPNLSFGPDFVTVCKKAGFFVDAHLMVANPETVFPWFKEADIITVHYEACKDPKKTLADIRKLGRKCGLAIKPKTPVDVMFGLDFDLALIMTVEPGFGGQKFMADQLPKISALAKRPGDYWIQCDGGINAQTIGLAVEAGADSIVAGSAVFNAKDPAAAARELIQKIS
jgi:ribulose-phosphate 3-epimerase